MAKLKVGLKAPEFKLISDSGDEISLSQFKGQKIMLYFYPKDDTPGCTKEACSFKDNITILKKKDIVVLGVSRDSLESHRKFVKKYKLNFPLLSDEDLTVLKKYGVWKKKTMMGKSYMGIERTTFIIDENGRISQIFPKVKVDGHVEEIINVL
ncbi:MAG: thioredoxin-dependent thiol peroxidase [Ignavibacteriales bacterium]|nr:thioredoxin-dependent thiol peroxidase [Ignavibacteriales bacterium]